MMPVVAQLVNSLSTTGAPLAPYRAVAAGIRGWSGEAHYIFFHHLLATPVKSILVCGVYQGLDLALLQCAAREHGRTVELTGVDLFLNAPLPDWQPWEKECGDWEKARMGPPPDIYVARNNAPGATIVQGDSVAFMESTKERFDVVYLDTSHDEAQVRKEIPAARAILNPGGILCGDDYFDTVHGRTVWGVDKAVQALLPHHVVFFNRIWAAQL